MNGLDIFGGEAFTVQRLDWRGAIRRAAVPLAVAVAAGTAGAYLWPAHRGTGFSAAAALAGLGAFDKEAA